MSLTHFKPRYFDGFATLPFEGNSEAGSKCRASVPLSNL